MARSPDDELLFEIDGPIAFVTFNRPEVHNALTWNMYDSLVDCCDRVDEDENVRVLVLKGAGDRAFASGTDISQFTELVEPQDALDYEKRIERAAARLERVAKPAIAMLRGACAGGGAVLALACDFRFAAPNLRFGVPIARTLGNCLSMANTKRLVDFVGPARTKELLMLARLLSAEEAAELGVVNEVVPAGRLEDRVRAVAAMLCDHAPLTLIATKEMIRRILAGEQSMNNDGEDLVLSCYMSDRFRESVRAFVEKKKRKK